MNNDTALILLIADLQREIERLRAIIAQSTPEPDRTTH